MKSKRRTRVKSKHAHIHEYICLHLKAKPKWLPQKAWDFLLDKLLILEKFKYYK